MATLFAIILAAACAVAATGAATAANCTCIGKPSCLAGSHAEPAGNCGGHGQYPYYCCKTAPTGPCDIYGAATPPTPCVAAHSMVRALYGNYNGPLYQVMRASDNTTADVGVLAAGGYANAAAQDAFCANTACVIKRIYDQSPKANHLDRAPPGGAHRAADRGASGGASSQLA